MSATTNARTLAELDQLAAAIEGLAEVGAIAYANGLPGQGAPIVDDRFKGQGNRRFIPLSKTTIELKAASLRKDKAAGKVRRGIFRGNAKGTGSKLLAGRKPILVETGSLRAAVTAGTATIQASPGNATVIFRGLPDYAVYLHSGTDKMPARSPVALNAADRERIVAAMRRALDARTGGAGRVAVSAATVPGRARLA